MAKADLTAQRLRELVHYSPETGVFTRIKDGRPLGLMSKHLGYWIVGVAGGQYYAHRLAWFYVHGVWPAGHMDHMDTDKLNNRLSNLRQVTQRVNNQNKRVANKNNSCGFLGVTHDAKNASPWVARIWVGGKQKYLGARKTPEEAYQLYVHAKRQIHEGCTL